MPDQDNRDTVQKIIGAVEHPDNPARSAALANQKSREQQQRQSGYVFASIFRLLFIVLLVALLIHAWSYQSTAQSRWISLVGGLVAGVLICAVNEIKKVPSQKKIIPPSLVLIAGIASIIINLLVVKFKSFVPQSVLSAITIFGISLLLIISIDGLLLYWGEKKT